MAVTTDRIVISGPDGFCVDPTATRDSSDTSFVLLGNCAAISNSRRAAQPATPAVLTATVSAPSAEGRLSDSLQQLDGFFRSDEGLTLLSRSGDPAQVTILDTALDGGVFLLHADDTSADAISGVQSEYWRAYLDVGPRIATLSVLSLEERNLTREESLSLLLNFVRVVQGANLDVPITAAPSQQEQPPQSDPTDPSVAPVPAAPRNLRLDIPALWNVGLFRRILG
ncbi:hypothetical protein [Roseicyclus sp.]|uniref:hypothetical protein n=1 Tax=Roseicyclus sp. TaxID=1914329 RepID=UPI003F6A9F42